MKNLFKSTVLAAAAAALAFGLAGCGDKQEAKSESAAAAPEVKIGVVGENNGEWEIAKKTLEGQGIKLTIVKFADYTLPNRSTPSSMLPSSRPRTSRKVLTTSASATP